MATHCDRKSIAVWNFIVNYSLYVDGFQLELDGDINKPARKKYEECWLYPDSLKSTIENGEFLFTEKLRRVWPLKLRHKKTKIASNT